MSAAIIPGKLLLVVPAVGGDSRTSVQAGTVDDPGISCDAAADLPAATYFDGYTLMQGSTAHVIQDNTIYTMQSDGTWILQDEASRMDVYTKTEIDTMLSDYTTTADQQVIDGQQDADISALQTDAAVYQDLLAELIDSGAKNRLKFDALTAGQLNGLTYTVNSDGTVTVSGSKVNPAQASYALFRINGTDTVYIDDLCDGKHVLSGCPSGGGSNTYRLYAAKSSYTRYDDGSGVLLSDTSITDIQLIINIVAGYDLTGPVTFSPMICSSAAWAVSHKFVPYCDTLQQIYNT